MNPPATLDDSVLDPMLRLHFDQQHTPSPEALEEGRAAMNAATDLLRMRKRRADASGEMASISEHIRKLAELADVSWAELVERLGLPSAAELNALSARTWARLAAMLGMPPQEIDLRVRWGHAFGSATMAAKPRTDATRTTGTPLDRLRSAEASFTEPQREKLDELRAAAQAACGPFT